MDGEKKAGTVLFYVFKKLSQSLSQQLGVARVVLKTGLKLIDSQLDYHSLPAL